MHYRAKRSIASDGLTVISYIPTFLLLDEDSFESGQIESLVVIMKAEIAKGNSFDIAFIKDCRYYLNEWANPMWGLPDDEVALCKELLDTINEFESQNIINTHKNIAIRRDKSQYCGMRLKCV